MKEKYFVYSIQDEHGDIIYIGYTNNIKRRLNEHQRGTRTFKKYKNLYEYCKSNSIFIDGLNIIGMYDNKLDAKLHEAYYILEEKLIKKNSKLQNVFLESFYLTNHILE
jgi:excinuclease UvrABC nuclease subunit